jgi:hypothetical protein
VLLVEDMNNLFRNCLDLYLKVSIYEKFGNFYFKNLVAIENKEFYEDLNVLAMVYFAFGKKALKRDKRMENILYLRILLK